MTFKCCTKLFKLKLNGRVSAIDLLGLIVLLPFYAAFIFVFSYIIVSFSLVVISMFLDVGSYKTAISIALVMLFIGLFVIKSLPKFLHACTFLLDYKLHIYGECRKCGKHTDIINVPKNSEPFD
jgi:hypothetical protein